MALRLTEQAAFLDSLAMTEQASEEDVRRAIIAAGTRYEPCYYES